MDDEVWWAILAFMIYIPFLFLWGFTLLDLFSRRDIGGWSKALWALGIIFLPLIGMFIYFLVRPKEIDSAWGADTAYGYSGMNYTSGQTSGPVRDLETLSQLHDRGTLNDQEFEQLKNKIIASPAA